MSKCPPYNMYGNRRVFHVYYCVTRLLRRNKAEKFGISSSGVLSLSLSFVPLCAITYHQPQKYVLLGELNGAVLGPTGTELQRAYRPLSVPGHHVL